MRYAETGYNLEIDLSRGNIEKVATDPKETELYLGGLGTNAKLLWDRVPPEVEAFSPENLLIFGAGLLLSSLYVYFRDINQIWDVLVTVLFFCSPIIYPLTRVPDYLMPYYRLNPVTLFIGMYRDVMVAGNLPSLFSIGVVIGFAIAAYLVGSFVFSKLQRRFAEEIG